MLQRRPNFLHQTDCTLRPENGVFLRDLLNLRDGFTKALAGQPGCLPAVNTGSETRRENPFVFFVLTHG
jgi:hypothetical protein